jgi:hypothetical protein
MLASEFGRKGSLFIRVVNGPFWFEDIQKGAEPHGIKPLGTDPLK